MTGTFLWNLNRILNVRSDKLVDAPGARWFPARYSMIA
jgi:hypothetical protein